MAVQYSVAVRNAMLDQIEVVAGASAKLQIRTGAQPATCATAASGTLLLEIALPADYYAAASGGTKVLSGSWTGTGAATGIAAHYRVIDNAGTTCHEQGSVTINGSGGDITLDNNNIAVSQVVTITSKTITAGNP